MNIDNREESKLIKKGFVVIMFVFCDWSLLALTKACNWVEILKVGQINQRFTLKTHIYTSK